MTPRAPAPPGAARSPLARIGAALLTLTSLAMTACSEPDAPAEATPGAEGPVPVRVVEGDDGWRLLRGGEPWTVRGAGMVRDDFERFVARGGNTVRNWTTRPEGFDLGEWLDAAHAAGVAVMLTLPMRPERHGFDYDDPAAVAAQLEAMREDVQRYRNHPALLAWIIGNELDHSFTNPAVFDAVNDVSRMIHEIDPHHPTTTALTGSGPELLAQVQARAPDLDFLSFQEYGKLFGLPDTLAASGFTGPFMVTEWGTIGWWEMETTPWGAPVELTSSEKAGVFERALNEILAPFEGQLIGSFAFLWGQKQERTPTWFGLLTRRGEATEAMDVLQRAWTGNEPDNRVPRVITMTLDGRTAREAVTLSAGAPYPARLEVEDPDGDPLTWRWELRPESDAEQVGGDFETAVPTIDGLLAGADTAQPTLTAPGPGAYRLFAYAYDGQGNAAHANIPFLVVDTLGQAPDDLVAGEVMALAYSGFREGQHPDRGEGAVNPSEAEILEDLRLLAEAGFGLVRMYDAGENTRTTLELIRRHDLPLRVLVGAWLKAEVSNHEGCPWLDEPIPEAELVANTLDNAAEIRRTIALATEFDDLVVAVNVGNEALVDWNDHMVPLEKVISYVREVKAAISQPVTVADNYEWWIRDGAPLAAEVDFLGVHTYPAWEGKPVEEALAYTVDNVRAVADALPGVPIAILEAGWATTASEFGERAGEAQQARYYEELAAWAAASNVTVFFFEAFDEPWKGDPANADGAEKHWGLFFVDRTPKQVLRKPAP